jgi:succinoglycan biosynthesis protein ExoU
MMCGSIKGFVDHNGNQPASARVDVLVAARDRADTIERAVLSALREDEVHSVIVIDDGSIDETAAKASRCDPNGNRVIVERLSSSRGPSAARNIGLGLSRAPWVAVLDGDDFFLPGRIAALLSKASGWDLIADDLVRVPEDHIEAELKPVLFADHRAPFALDLEQFVLGDAWPGREPQTGLGFLKPLIRRSFLDRNGLRYDESLRLGEDYALYARALAMGARFLIVPNPGYASVVRSDSISAIHNKQDLERFRDYDLELMAMNTLSVPERQALAKHFCCVDCRVQWIAVIEAIKARSMQAFLRPFFRSTLVSTYLLQKLVSELAKRSLANREAWDSNAKKS